MIFNKSRSSEKMNNNVIGYKLCTLLSFLKQTTSEFETVAKKLHDKDLKMALLGIAVETNQYANELNAQIKSLDIKYIQPQVQFNSNDVTEYIYAATTANGIENVSVLCSASENFFITAYCDILNESIPYPSLKKMITYQFNGIKGAFMKMRLFDLVRTGYATAVY
jgi:hypothetical protein